MRARLCFLSLAASLLAVVALAEPGPGAMAPDFSLKDVDGKGVKLADLKGKVVVLEWFNPECPFVRKAHTQGSLEGLANKHAPEGVVWLAINSGAAGRQGSGAERNRSGRRELGFDYAVLLDETGTVGRAYGATNTPHLFVIDKDGKLAYRGAIDNSPDGEGKSTEGGTLVNYVDEALADLAAGRAVRTPVTKAYGCGVKYGT